MYLPTPDDHALQPFRVSVMRVLLRCVDMAECQSDAKSMILTMHEGGLLSCAATFAEIVTRGLQSA